MDFNAVIFYCTISTVVGSEFFKLDMPLSGVHPGVCGAEHDEGSVPTLLPPHEGLLTYSKVLYSRPISLTAAYVTHPHLPHL